MTIENVIDLFYNLLHFLHLFNVVVQFFDYHSIILFLFLIWKYRNNIVQCCILLYKKIIFNSIKNFLHDPREIIQYFFILKLKI